MKRTSQSCTHFSSSSFVRTPPARSFAAPVARRMNEFCQSSGWVDLVECNAAGEGRYLNPCVAALASDLAWVGLVVSAIVEDIRTHQRAQRRLRAMGMQPEPRSWARRALRGLVFAALVAMVVSAVGLLIHGGVVNTPLASAFPPFLLLHGIIHAAAGIAWTGAVLSRDGVPSNALQKIFSVTLLVGSLAAVHGFFQRQPLLGSPAGTASEAVPLLRNEAVYVWWVVLGFADLWLAASAFVPGLAGEDPEARLRLDARPPAPRRSRADREALRRERRRRRRRRTRPLERSARTTGLEDGVPEFEAGGEDAEDFDDDDDDSNEDDEDEDEDEAVLELRALAGELGLGGEGETEEGAGDLGESAWPRVVVAPRSSPESSPQRSGLRRPPLLSVNATGGLYPARPLISTRSAIAALQPLGDGSVQPSHPVLLPTSASISTSGSSGTLHAAEDGTATVGPALGVLRARPRKTHFDAGWCGNWLTFSWLTDLFDRGEVRQLAFRDLDLMPEADTTRHWVRAFDAILVEEAARLEQAYVREPAADGDASADGDAAADVRPPRRIRATWRGRCLARCCTCCCGFRVAAEDPHDGKSFLRALWRLTGWAWFAMGLLQLGNVALSFAGPLLLSGLVAFLEAENGVSPWTGIGWALLMVLAAATTAVLGTQFDFRISRLQLRVRAAIVGAVFRRTLLVAPADRARFSSGSVNNFMSVDVQKVMDIMSSFHQLWSLPVQVSATLYLLYRQVSWAFGAGVLVLAIFLPINTLITRRIGGLTAAMMRFRDERVRLCGEMLHGVRILKLQAWEEPLLDRIRAVRAQEVAQLAARKYLDALCVYLWASTPVIVALATFGTVVWIDPSAGAAGAAASAASASSPLGASSVFTALSLLNLLIFPMNAFPWVLSGCLEASVSFQRLDSFLLDTRVRRPPALLADVADATGTGSDTVCLIEGSFRWHPSAAALAKRGEAPEPASASPSEPASASPSESSGSSDRNREEFLLVCPRLTVSSGECVVVVGSVGSGKSALLQALLGELREASPEARVQCAASVRSQGIALAPQIPWVREASFRDNVLNGEPWDPTRYRAVIAACCLDVDVPTFRHGHDTIIGERGVNLSGGQRQRLGLARALYSRAPLLLIDDPISALDPAVARTVWARAVGADASGASWLARERRARLIVTHDAQCARQCDRLVVLEHGRVLFNGPPLALGDGLARRAGLVRSDEGRGRIAPEVAASSSAAASSAAAAASVPEPTFFAHEVPHEATVGAAESIASPGTRLEPRGSDSDSESQASIDSREGLLMSMERREEGAIRGHVVGQYLRSVGWAVVTTTILSMVTMQLSRNGSDWWLSEWSAAISGGAGGGNGTGAASSSSSFAPSDDGEAAEGVGSSWIQAHVASWSARDFLLVYGVIAGANTLFTLARSFLFAWGGIRGAVSLHDQLLRSVFAAPLAFFDANPVGRLLNRFSRDQYSVDESLPFMLNIFLAQSFGLSGTLLVLAYATGGVFLIAVPAIAVFYVLLQRKYRATSRELKRLDSVTRSPMYSHFSECLTGADVLRAAGQRAIAREFVECVTRMDRNQRACFASNVAGQWLAFRLQSIGVFVLLFIAAFAVLDHALGTTGGPTATACHSVGDRSDRTHEPSVAASLVAGIGAAVAAAAATAATSGSDGGSGQASAGLAGLALAYALPIVGALQGLIGSFTETEKEMVSVERETEYIEVLPETDAPMGGRDPTPPPKLPRALRLHGRGWGRGLTAPLLAANGGDRIGDEGNNGGDDGEDDDEDDASDDDAIGVAIPHSSLVAPPPVHWPSRGAISLRSLSVRYPGAARPALRNVSLEIHPGESVGIVGRTGSGKSTLLLALFRLVPWTRGAIVLDGVDVRHVALRDLRARLAVIPQDPTLFSGTVRFNLDPEGRYAGEDERLRSALRAVGLARAVGPSAPPPPLGLDVGLEDEVVEGGVNWSVGQRQLLSLARALLRQARVVCIDEATASVDAATDAAMQRVLAEHFRGATVLNIAHRLATLARCTRVMVIDAGRVVEFDTPERLRARPGSLFGQMERAGQGHRAGIIG